MKATHSTLIISLLLFNQCRIASAQAATNNEANLTNIPAASLSGSLSPSQLPSNVVYTNGPNGQTIYQYINFNNGFGFGSPASMGFGISQPTWFLAGNPNDAVWTRTNADYGIQLISLNPYSRATWSLGYSSTNAKDWQSGPMLTNVNGDVIGGQLNAASFVIENAQGILNNMPGVANLVNNGGRFAISDSAPKVNGVFGDYPYIYCDDVSSSWGTPLWEPAIFTNIYRNAIGRSNTIHWAWKVNPYTGDVSNLGSVNSSGAGKFKGDVVTHGNIEMAAEASQLWLNNGTVRMRAGGDGRRHDIFYLLDHSGNEWLRVWGNAGLVWMQPNDWWIPFADGDGGIGTNGNAVGYVYAKTNVVGREMVSQGVASTISNNVPLATITANVSPFNWTNVTGMNGYMLSAGGSVSAITLNGTSLPGAFLAGPNTLPMKPNDVLTITFTTAPSLLWKPF